MTVARQLRAVACLELAEVRRSRWILFCLAVYGILGAGLVLVGLRESTLLGFTGIGRVLLGFAQALVLVLPLLALTAVGQVVGRARDDGTLELLFGHPIGRGAYIAGVTLVRYLALLAPLAVMVVGLGVYGQLVLGDQVAWPFVWRTLAVGAALLWAFTGVGLAISVLVRSPARAVIAVILAWGLGVALLDFGLIAVMLRWRIDAHAVFTLAALNPVEDARLALLAGLDPDLATLGPVGFYLATRLGPALLFVLGVVWPLAVGAGAWALAFRSFRRDDPI